VWWIDLAAAEEPVASMAELGMPRQHGQQVVGQRHVAF